MIANAVIIQFYFRAMLQDSRCMHVPLATHLQLGTWLEFVLLVVTSAMRAMILLSCTQRGISGVIVEILYFQTINAVLNV